MIVNVNITDYISIGLGVISVLFTIYAIYQSYKYKNLGNKFDEYMQISIQKNIEILCYSAIMNRDIREKISGDSHLVNLHKDELYIFKSLNYKMNNTSQVIDKLNKELPKLLKQTYINKIMGNLNLDDGCVNLICIVTLRQ